MPPFDRIVIIFNPNSTGSAPEMAEQLRDDLAQRLPDVPVSMSPTERAGHARELAEDAGRSGAPLVVSVSGDGGYNEVVDGLMRAGNDRVIGAVMGAGNANDHRRTMKERPLADAIVAADVHHIDLLRLTIEEGAEVRYAHSYIGVGLTPVVAIDMEEGGKGSFKEIVSVVRAFAKFRPFRLRMEDGTVRSVDSLVFANISQMAKYATLSEDSEPDDGVFEVITVPHAPKWKVLRVAIRAATRGLGKQPSVRHFGFTTLAPTPLQLDGEVLALEANTRVSVDVATRVLAEIS